MQHPQRDRQKDKQLHKHTHTRAHAHTHTHALWQVCISPPQKGQGAPGREPVFSEEEQKQMMLHAYRRQEELKVKIF